ncbi:MAG: MarR family transcriptional regulator [Actinobacteria bacterium]|nr:MarR family transcriptional regulator [Actinomycetota bacterium]
MEPQGIDIVKGLLLLGAFLQRQAGRALVDFGINQQQFVVLKEIGERGPINQKDLCSALLFQKSNISKIVAKLERLGLVRREVDSDDNRVTPVSLSKKGQEVIRLGMDSLNQWNMAWLDSLSKAEIERIATSLEKLTALAHNDR